MKITIELKDKQNYFNGFYSLNKYETLITNRKYVIDGLHIYYEEDKTESVWKVKNSYIKGEKMITSYVLDKEEFIHSKTKII